MTRFHTPKRQAKILVAICRELGIRTQVWYSLGKERVDVYASESEAGAALEMSGIKSL